MPKNMELMAVKCGQVDHKATIAPMKSFAMHARIEAILQSFAQKFENAPTARTRSTVICYKCGKMGHISTRCNSRSGITCFNCGNVGHVRNQCMAPRGGSQNSAQPGNEVTPPFAGRQNFLNRPGNHRGQLNRGSRGHAWPPM